MKVGTRMEDGYSHDRRDETATPLCGAHRKNKTNPLLIKPSLGQVKPTTYNLPSNFQHEYGLKQERDGLTSEAVVGNWAQHDGTKGQMPARDFKALNKSAVQAGMLDCKGMAEYRKTHDVRLKLGSEKKAAATAFDENTSFGRPTRPSTPFGDLVSHGFRYDWVMQSEPAEQAVQRKKNKKPAMTKASMGHASVSAQKLAEEQEQILWKLHKFQNVSAKIGQQG